MERGAVAFQVTRFKTLGVPRSSREDNIKIDLQDGGWGGLDCIDWLRVGTGGGRF